MQPAAEHQETTCPSRSVARLATSSGMVALGLLLAAGIVIGRAGCGEFKTIRFYQQTDATSGTDSEQDSLPGDTSSDLGTYCDAWESVTILTQELPAALTHLPYFVVLDSWPRAGVTWVLASGNLPIGLSLDSDLGTISGLPAYPGSYTLTLAAMPHEGLLPCYLPGKAVFKIDVSSQCEEAAQCFFPHVPDSLQPQCELDYCIYDLPPEGEGCPKAPSSYVKWRLESSDPDMLTAALPNLSAPGPDSPFWTVESHSELPISQQNGQSPFQLRHRLDLVSGSVALSLFYSIPNEWPLPYRKGDRVAVAAGASSYAGSSALAMLWKPESSMVTLLYDGVPDQNLLSSTCQLPPFCDFAFHLLPLGCPAQPDVCGNSSPSALAVLAEDSLPFFAIQGVHAKTKIGGEEFVLAVGRAHSYTSFDSFTCSSIPPSGASFVLYPLDSCPIAGIETTAKAAVLLGSALGATPVAYFKGVQTTPPFASKIVRWGWTLEQPFQSLVKLVPHGTQAKPSGGPGPWALEFRTAGSYRVYLKVKDESGTSGCIDNLLEFSVAPHPSIDLRVELIWRVDGSADPQDGGKPDGDPADEHAREGEEDPENSDSSDLEDDRKTDTDGSLDLDILLKYPYYSKVEDVSWVCSQDNPAPGQWGAEQCEVRAGNMSLGIPEVLTLAGMRSDHILPYRLFLRSRGTNTLSARADVKVYLNQKLAHEGFDLELQPSEELEIGTVPPGGPKFVETATKE